ncbi:MAG: ester cyclase [Promethearchaeota archaeon]
MEKNKEAATRFIEAFNNDDWDSVREVVTPNFFLHHPVGGDVQLGPEGMIGVWSHFKAALPDSWHPIPVMITEGDYLANLLPTYGNFTGEPHQGIPPTGKWLEYGMVNIVRFENGKLAEAWFGMDPLAEMQQMGAVPLPPLRPLSTTEKANIELFKKTINTSGLKYDNLTAFNDVVVALGPPQYVEDSKTRKLEIYRLGDNVFSLIRSHEFPTIPPYSGDSSADKELGRAVVTRFFEDVLIGHNSDVLIEIASPDILIHSTAMPCEANYYGIKGLSDWLGESWNSFPDLSILDYFTVAQGDIIAVHWTAQGTSQGNFMILPPTEKVVKYTGVSMYRIEEGKIAEIWETRNTLGIMRQLNPEIGGGHHHH